MKGRIGLQLVLKNGKSILIGTQLPEYLKDVFVKLEKISGDSR